jgi:hypothetical protein
VATLLGICFRLFADPKNPDSVVNTAATTVRQVIVIMKSTISPLHCFLKANILRAGSWQFLYNVVQLAHL